MELNKYIDHTLLKANLTKKDLNKLIKEAISYDFKSVCVNPYYVKYCKKKLQNSDVLVCTVIGFPLGQNSLKTKIFEAKQAIKDGADELDLVINISELKNHNYKYLEKELTKIREVVKDKTLKVIIETCYLTDEEKTKITELIIKTNCDFVKTSTGFGTKGATFEDVKLLKSVTKDQIQIKASGGIKTKEDFLKYLELGATRIGTSNGIALITDEDNKKNKEINNY